MSGSLFTTPRFIPIGVSGRPLAGALLYVYRAGTSVLANTYTSAELDTPHANPLVAGALGFPAIYLDPAAGFNFRFVLQDADGAQVWAEDNVPAVSGGTGGGTGGAGQDGQPGLSVAEILIYQRSDLAPATPTGGSYSFDTLTATPPDGWYAGIPTGSAPVWASSAVAAIEGITGSDATLFWSTPVKVLSDGSSVNIIFRRAASQPSTPAPSSAIPLDWYDNVADVPASSDLLWSSVGTRPHEGSDWIWQLPIQVEGEAGPQGPGGTPGATGPTGPTGATGPSATLYYIRPTNGTAIKNGSGSLTLEARRVENGVDSLLSSGDVKLYVGNTVVTEANGYATGSTGYVGVFDAGDINGAAIVTLKVADGVVRDSITLVDVADGEADTGKNAVYGYIAGSGPLAWVRGTDQTTWTPSATTLQLDCTFVQGGAEVARVAWVLTRDTDGLLTGASGTHTGGDLNGSRVTVTEINEGTRVMSVKFFYSYGGDESAVAETVLTSLSGGPGDPGDPGEPGEAALTLRITRPVISLLAWANGGVVSYADAFGYVSVYSGTTDVTSGAALVGAAVGCTVQFNTAPQSPVITEPKGYVKVTNVSADNARYTVTATYNGESVTQGIAVARTYVGYEIVSALPTSNNFIGRVVFLSSQDGVNAPNKLYRYTSTGWTSLVPAVDIAGQITSTQIADNAISTPKIVAGSVTASRIYSGTVDADLIQTNNIRTGAVTAAKISVNQLSALTQDVGDLRAGVIRSPDPLNTGYSATKFDLTNGRIIYNSAPGRTGGTVRVQGGGFGPGGVYLDWYGPKPAGEITDAGIIENLTDDAAYYFLKTSGLSKSVAQRIRGEFEPKAWGKWREAANGTITMLDCFNVASMVYGGRTGLLIVTFASELPNANYAVAMSANNGDTEATRPLICGAYQYTTVGFKIRTIGDGGNSNNAEAGSFVVFGSNVTGGSNASTPSGGTGGGTIGWGNLPGNYILP